MNRLRKMVEIPIKRFTEYDPDLIRFYENRGSKLPSLDTRTGQALAWMSQPYMRGGKCFITRAMCTKFLENIGLYSNSGDAIQHFNKPENTFCMKRHQPSRKSLYNLKFPFESTDMTKRKNLERNVLENGSKDEQISYVKNHHLKKMKSSVRDCEMFFELWKLTGSEEAEARFNEELSHIKWTFENIIDLPNENWEIGHLDATKGNGPSNLFYQPNIQSKFLDKYVFNREFDDFVVKVKV